MLENVGRVLTISVMAMILFCAFFLVSVSFFGIDDPINAVVVAKAISLIGLASFGQSEALSHYLRIHTAEEAGWIRHLNAIGIMVTVGIVVLLVLKLVPLSEIDRGSRAGAVWYAIKDHLDLAAFLPIVFFSLVNLLVWAVCEGGREIGRVCFAVTDAPIIMPMAVSVFLSVFLGGYGTNEFRYILGGATVMFILVSIVLNECARGLLTVQSQKAHVG